MPGTQGMTMTEPRSGVIVATVALVPTILLRYGIETAAANLADDGAGPAHGAPRASSVLSILEYVESRVMDPSRLPTLDLQSGV